MKKTAIMLSIERKEMEINSLKLKLRQKTLSDFHEEYKIKMSFLESEIEFDKRLRDTTEREQIEEAYETGSINSHSEITADQNITGKQYYQKTYGNGE